MLELLADDACVPNPRPVEVPRPTAARNAPRYARVMTSARKIKLRLTAPKPRNPLVAPALQRKAGAHRRSTSAERRAAKQALAKALRKGDA